MTARWLSVCLGIALSTAPLAAQDTASPPIMQLAKESGCLECHAVDKKVIGPAWADVAARYKGDPAARERLVEKVKRGGKGNWSEITHGVPMPSHALRVTDEQITRLVTWILSLEPGKQ